MKTTAGGSTERFKVTVNELEFSRLYTDQYHLHRVYHLDVKTGSARFLCPGSLAERFTLIPVIFEVLRTIRGGD